VLLPGAELPSFVSDQAVRVEEQPGGWEQVAQLIEAPEKPAFRWETTDSARSELSERLDQVERFARTLPTDTDVES
jgi:hypothetical protein